MVAFDVGTHETADRIVDGSEGGLLRQARAALHLQRLFQRSKPGEQLWLPQAEQGDFERPPRACAASVRLEARGGGMLPMET